MGFYKFVNWATAVAVGQAGVTNDYNTPASWLWYQGEGPQSTNLLIYFINLFVCTKEPVTKAIHPANWMIIIWWNLSRRKRKPGDNDFCWIQTQMNHNHYVCFTWYKRDNCVHDVVCLMSDVVTLVTTAWCCWCRWLATTTVRCVTECLRHGGPLTWHTSMYTGPNWGLWSNWFLG